MDNQIIKSLIRHSNTEILDSVSRETAIINMAEQYEVSCSAEELSEAADKYRLEHNLLTYEDTMAWLELHHWQAGDFEDVIRLTVLESKLHSLSVIEEGLHTRFHADPSAYDLLWASRLVVKDEGIATELALLYQESGYKFDVLVRRYSIESSQAGSVATTTRRNFYRHEIPELPDDASQQKPILINPTYVGDAWHLYLVFSVKSAELNEATSEHIKKQLLNEQLNQYKVNLSEYFDSL